MLKAHPSIRLLAGIMLFGVLLGMGLVMMLSQSVPEQLEVRYTQAVHRARMANADMLAPEQLHLAKVIWESSQAAIRNEQQKWYWGRDYQRAADEANRALFQFAVAESLALKRHSDLFTETSQRIADIKVAIKTLKDHFNQLPFESDLHLLFTACELKFMEGRAAFERSDYLLASARLTAAAQEIQQVSAAVEQKLKDYFKDSRQWQKWVSETIAGSKINRSAAIVVDKMAHRCRLYIDGQLVGSYPTEMGPNWMGDKHLRGDKTTPEGKYFIVEKKSGSATRYHLALLINYPNADDRRRFSRALREGNIPLNSKIGGLIEIHGDGGKGVNWTDGCVALSNVDMESLYAKVIVGTPVTIVGTLNSTEGMDE